MDTIFPLKLIFKHLSTELLIQIRHKTQILRKGLHQNHCHGTGNVLQQQNVVDRGLTI